MYEFLVYVLCSLWHTANLGVELLGRISNYEGVILLTIQFVRSASDYLQRSIFWFLADGVPLEAHFGCAGSSLLRSGFSAAVMRGLLLVAASLAADPGASVHRLRSCDFWVLEPRAGCPRACGILPDQGLTCVSCIGR